MSTKKRIDYLTIKGFKSIRNLDNLRLRSLNVLIGGNGVGKSNFVDYFRMLSEMMAGRLQLWVSRQGGADRILSYGVKETVRLQSYWRLSPCVWLRKLSSGLVLTTRSVGRCARIGTRSIWSMNFLRIT